MGMPILESLLFDSFILLITVPEDYVAKLAAFFLKPIQRNTATDPASEWDKTGELQKMQLLYC